MPMISDQDFQAFQQWKSGGGATAAPGGVSPQMRINSTGQQPVNWSPPAQQLPAGAYSPTPGYVQYASQRAPQDAQGRYLVGATGMPLKPGEASPWDSDPRNPASLPGGLGVSPQAGQPQPQPGGQQQPQAPSWSPPAMNDAQRAQAAANPGWNYNATQSGQGGYWTYGAPSNGPGSGGGTPPAGGVEAFQKSWTDLGRTNPEMMGVSTDAEGRPIGTNGDLIAGGQTRAQRMQAPAPGFTAPGTPGNPTEIHSPRASWQPPPRQFNNGMRRPAQAGPTSPGGTY